MPLDIVGSCRCSSVKSSCKSHTPVPYQRCYCSICRKTAGRGGYAISIGATSKTLRIVGEGSIGVFRVELKDDAGNCELSTAERRFCTICGSALWLISPEWSDLIHPFASIVVHMTLRCATPWATPLIQNGDAAFDLYPDFSLEDRHRKHDMWVS